MCLAWTQRCQRNVCLPITLWGGEKEGKKKKMERTFLSSFCSSSVSIASLFSPAASLPPPHSLSLAFSSFSLPSVAIYPLSHFFFLPLSKMPPTLIYPFYLPPSFRRHFSSSSPVAHPGVTRFSVAGGEARRKPAQSGGQPTTCGTQTPPWWSRVVWFSE